MLERTLSLIKPLFLAAFAVAVFSLGQGAARADEVFIRGYTNGCFNCVTPPNTIDNQRDVIPAPGPTGGLGVLFGNSQFAGTTSGGFLGIGGGAVVPTVSQQNVLNLGAIFLGTAAGNYTGNTFTLRVTFFDPAGIEGSNSVLFQALLTGSVTSEQNGGIRIDFDNTPRTFVFSTPNTFGSFQFQINDFSINPGINPGMVGPLSGDITSAQMTTTPEPATLILLGTGLAGVAARFRRRASKG